MTSNPIVRELTFFVATEAENLLIQQCVKRLAETAGAMKVSGGFEPGVVIGPLAAPSLRR